MSNKDQKIISRLLDNAKKSELNQKLAAAIYCGNKLLSLNINSHRNKFGKEIKSSGHCEIACLYDIFPEIFKANLTNYVSPRTKFKPNNLTLYVVRYLKTGKNYCGHSAPCVNCTEKIKRSGIKKIVYIDENCNIIKKQVKNYNSNFITSGYRTYSRNNVSVPS